MRVFRVIGLAVVALLVAGITTAGPAWAATEWLWNSEPIPAPLATETAGEVLFEDMNAFVKADILCSVTFDGTVGPGAADKIEKILTLAGAEEETTNLSGVKVPAISCTIMEKGSCEEANGSLIWVIPVNLPWNTTLLLPTATLWVDDLESSGAGAPGFTISCKTALLGVVTDTCTGTPGADLTNETGGVLGLFENDATNNPPGNCTVGGAGENLLESEVADLTLTPEGGTLSVS